MASWNPRLGTLAFVWLFFGINGVPAQPSIRQNALTVSYAKEKHLCAKFLKHYSSFSSCSLKDGDCFSLKWNAEPNAAMRGEPMTDLVTNQYGYTQINVTHLAGQPYSIVYLNNFQGDRHPRIVETWKIETKELRALIEREPRPMTQPAWVSGTRQFMKEAYAVEFATLLSRSERISDPDSGVWYPHFTESGVDYVVSRECAGRYAYGGDYDCARIIKLKVKRLATGDKSLPVCEFVSTSKK